MAENSHQINAPKAEIISFNLAREDLAAIGEVVSRLQVTTGVDVEHPGAFVIRNHSFSTTAPGAFVIRNHVFDRSRPGAYTIRNYQFSSTD